MTLQERWITSGASRLKARQNRGFILRMKQKASIGSASSRVMDKNMVNGRRKIGRRRIIIGQTASSFPSTKAASLEVSHLQSLRTYEVNENQKRDFPPVSQRGHEVPQKYSGDLRHGMPNHSNSCFLSETQSESLYQQQGSVSEVSSANFSNILNHGEPVFAGFNPALSYDQTISQQLLDMEFENHLRLFQGDKVECVRSHFEDRSTNLYGDDPLKLELSASSFHYVPSQSSRISNVLTTTREINNLRKGPIDPWLNEVSTLSGFIRLDPEESKQPPINMNGKVMKYNHPFSPPITLSHNMLSGTQMQKVQNGCIQSFNKDFPTISKSAMDIAAQKVIAKAHSNLCETPVQSSPWLKKNKNYQSEFTYLIGAQNRKSPIQFFNEGIEVSRDGSLLSPISSMTEVASTIHINTKSRSSAQNSQIDLEDIYNVNDCFTAQRSGGNGEVKKL